MTLGSWRLLLTSSLALTSLCRKAPEYGTGFWCVTSDKYVLADEQTADARGARLELQRAVTNQFHVASMEEVFEFITNDLGRQAGFEGRIAASIAA